MQDSKDRALARELGERDTDIEAANDKSASVHAGDVPEIDGWQQYRRWISKAPVPRSRRGGVDPTLYTWKGYRSWTEQVKRNWHDK